MSRHAEIAGAGFAGPVAAAALAQRGWTVRLHEAAPAPRSIGSGIYIFPFAQEVLQQIGALDALRRVAFTPQRRTIVIDGQLRSVTATSDLLTTTRARLHEVLLTAARTAGVELCLNSTATGADPAGALILADGRRVAADLVVAADGARSAVASAAGFALQRTRYADGITRVLLTREGLSDPDWDGIIDMYDYRYRPLRALYTPCGADAFYFCLMAPVTDSAAAAIPVDAALWSASFPQFAAAFGRIGGSGRHDRYGTTRLDRWSRGRIAIVGDAAHAMPSSLGQGAGVSMMNALRLAEAVSESDDVATSLVAWEGAARPLIERWQHQAEQVATERSLADMRHPGTDLVAEMSNPLEAA